MILTAQEIQQINDTIASNVQNSSEWDDAAFRRIISRAVSHAFHGTSCSLKEKQEIVEFFFRRIRGYDVLQPLIDDENITEIMVNGPDRIFYEKFGVLHQYKEVFDSRKRPDRYDHAIFRKRESQYLRK